MIFVVFVTLYGRLMSNRFFQMKSGGTQEKMIASGKDEQYLFPMENLKI